jgi:hypothetical protein
VYAKNVTERNLIDVAHSLGFETKPETVRDNYIKFTLRNKSNRFHAVHDGRTTKSLVCFHGHYLFLDTLFDIFPNAVVDASRSGQVRYTVGNFEDEAEEIGNNIVRQYDQLRIRDKCNCDEEEFYADVEAGKGP